MSEPAITRKAANYDEADNLPITRIVLHGTNGGRGFPHESEAGVAKNTASYFAKKSTQASAHYIVDVENEEHCVPENRVAWHAPPNHGSIGIEICADGGQDVGYSREQWLSPEVWPAVELAAKRVVDLCDRYGIPKVRISPVDLAAGRKGICAHADVSETWHESSHTDVGPNFPWPEFLALVNPASPAPAPAPAPVPAPVPAPRPGNQTNPPTPRPLPAWPFSGKAHYGNIAGDANSHGGFYSWERPAVRLIQQWLIFHGCVSYVSPDRCLSSSWADGIWQDETDAAMTTWHNKFYPNQPAPKDCYADDYVLLGRR